MRRNDPKAALFKPETRLPRGANLVLRCKSGDMSSRAILRQITRRLSDMEIDKDSIESIEIVLAEALNNIVEHAYAGRTEGPLELRAYADGGNIRFEIVDEGRPMPGLTPPMGKAVPDGVKLFDVPEGGFGWHLIRSLARDFDYRRLGRYNYTSFDLAIGSL